MAGIDESREFQAVRIAVLTISDTRSAATDSSGDILQGRIEAAGHILAGRDIVPDDIAAVQNQVKAWAADLQVEAIITTGGTGLTGRDITPEALRPLFDKEIDGFSIIWHKVSFESVGLSTLQSRALAGIASGTIIFALPGSNGAVKDGWDKIIRHEIDIRHMPCNLAQIMPGFMER